MDGQKFRNIYTLQIFDFFKQTLCVHKLVANIFYGLFVFWRQKVFYSFLGFLGTTASIEILRLWISCFEGIFVRFLGR